MGNVPYDYRRSTSSSSRDVEVIFGVAIGAVLASMAAVGLQIAVEAVIGSIAGAAVGTALFAGMIPILIVAALQGAINALVIQAFLRGDSFLVEEGEDRIRGYLVAALTGAAIAVMFATMVGPPGHSGGGSGTDLDEKFLPLVFFLAIFMVCAGVVGAIVSLVLNRGLMFLGLVAAKELAEEGGGYLARHLAPRYLSDLWRRSDDGLKGDEAIALVNGLAVGTRWLSTCRAVNSNAIVRGLLSGMISATAVFHLELSLHGDDYGFIGQVVMELLGASSGCVGALLIYSLVVTIFRFPLELLEEIVKTVMLIGTIVLIFKACSH